MHKKAAAKPAEVVPPEATPEQVAAAERVFYGNYGCEFKQTIDIEKNAKYPAYVDVRSGKSHWLMKPVVSSTGAVRLEDVKGETLMVQIASKSMLLNVKTAQRIVDDCVCEEQRQLAQAARAGGRAGDGERRRGPLLLETPAASDRRRRPWPARCRRSKAPRRQRPRRIRLQRALRGALFVRTGSPPGTPRNVRIIRAYIVEAGMEATVAERGQITLPKAVRDALGLTKGTQLKVELEGGRIILRKNVDDAVSRARGRFRLPDGVTTDDVMRELRGRAPGDPVEP